MLHEPIHAITDQLTPSPRTKKPSGTYRRAFGFSFLLKAES